MKTRSIILALVAITFFSGCISITKELPAFKTYSLNIDKNNFLINKKNYSISIKEPKALSSINTKHITYLKGNRYESYALSRWSDNPTKMIQKVIVSNLSESNNYKYVVSSKINIQSDYKVVSELDSFRQVFKDNGSFVEFKLRAYIKAKDGKVYHKNFKYVKQCDQHNAQGAVKSLDHIINIFVNDLNIWILDTL